MNEDECRSDAAGAIIEPNPEPPRKRTRKATFLGYAVLALGLIALGLAGAPGLAMGEPFGLRFSELETQIAKERERQTSVASFKHHVKIGPLSFSFGKKKQSEAIEETAPLSPRLTAMEHKLALLKNYQAASFLVGLAGLGTSVFAGRKRENRTVVSSGALMCCFAMVWQYVVIGIAVAVGLAVLFAILSSFAN